MPYTTLRLKIFLVLAPFNFVTTVNLQVPRIRVATTFVDWMKHGPEAYHLVDAPFGGV